MAIKPIKSSLELVGRGAHEWENVKNINDNFAELAAGGGGGGPTSVAWDDIEDKPSTFAPVIGTTATTALAGNTVIPPAATADNLSGATTVGKSVMKAADAAAARAAIGAGTSNVKVGTGAADALAGNTVIPPAATADTLGGATTVGKALMKAADAAAGRTAIGAGTSNLAIGTTATTAKAGNYVPAWGDVTGKPTTFAPIIGTTATTAKAGNAVQTATQTTATAVGGGTATNVQAILVELEARIAALESAGG